MTSPKNYSFISSSNKWRVNKRINGKNVLFGYYDSEEIAQQIVGELKRIGWDKNQLPSIQERLGLSKNYVRGEPKYYHFDEKNGWKVSKKINGQRLTFGHYDSEKDAQMVVSELKKVGWDKNQLSSIKKKLGINEKVKNISFISQTGLYQVKHKHVVYGGYESEEDAQKVVTFMRDHEWDKSQLKKFLSENDILAHINCKKPKYYYFRKERGTWVVKIKGHYVGSYATENAAQKAVKEYFRKH